MKREPVLPTELAPKRMGSGYAYHCEECDQQDPAWRITRVGDVVTTWACNDHLWLACERLQRDWEETKLTVFHPASRDAHTVTWGDHIDGDPHG